MAVSYPQSGCSDEQDRPWLRTPSTRPPEFGVERAAVGPDFLTLVFQLETVVWCLIPQHQHSHVAVSTSPIFFNHRHGGLVVKASAS